MLINISESQIIDPVNGCELSAEFYQWLSGNQHRKVLGMQDLPPLECGSMLIHSKENQWHVLEDKLGEGCSGIVYKSTKKIILVNGKARLFPTNDIIKSQPISDDGKSCLEEIANEARLQARQRVRVEALVVAGDRAYTIIENCGVGLDTKLPLGADKDWDYRLALVLAICNEVQLLEQVNVVHRDLKPENICFRQTGPKTFIVSLIDFRFSHELGSNSPSINGSLHYMSPESVDKTTLASDIWALGPLIGVIFDTPDLFADRLDAYKAFASKNLSLAEFVKSGYRYDHLFAGLKIPGDVDPVLLDDFKKVLQLLQSKNPKSRPPIAFLNKFFLLIAARRTAYADFLKDFNELHTGIRILQNQFKKLEERGQSLNEPGKEQDFLTQGIKLAGKTRSHFELTETMLRENVLAGDYPNPFPNLKPLLASVTELISATEQEIARPIPRANSNEPSKLGIINDLSRLMLSSKTPLEAVEKLDIFFKSDTRLNPKVSTLQYVASFFGRHPTAPVISNPAPAVPKNQPQSSRLQK